MGSSLFYLIFSTKLLAGEDKLVLRKFILYTSAILERVQLKMCHPILRTPLSRTVFLIPGMTKRIILTFCGFVISGVCNVEEHFHRWSLHNLLTMSSLAKTQLANWPLRRLYLRRVCSKTLQKGILNSIIWTTQFYSIHLIHTVICFVYLASNNSFWVWVMDVVGSLCLGWHCTCI
jgi:hypothetical protein